MFKRFIWLFLSILWMFLIYYMSSKTAETSSNDSMFITDYIIRFFIKNPPEELLSFCENIIRKIAHFTEYLILCILLIFTLKSFGFSHKKYIFAVAISFLYATSDEIHQAFVPGRACRVFDIFIDTFGALFGYLIYLFFAKFLKKRT